MSYDALGKFQIVSGPLQQTPHKCAGCSRYQDQDGKDLDFFDWNFEVDFWGKIFICVDCVREMANQLDFISPDQARSLRKAWEEDQELIQALQFKNEVLNNAVADFGSGSNSDRANRFSSVGARQESEPLVTVGAESTGREEGSVQQVDEQGFTDLSNDDSLNEFL